MSKSIAVTFSLVVLALPAPVMAWDNNLELEAARARARAGYAISAYDAELLERFDCSNGIEDDYCRWLKYKEQRSRHYTKKRRRYDD